MAKVFKHRIITVNNKDLVRTLDELSMKGIAVVTVIASVNDSHQIIVKEESRYIGQTIDLNKDKHKAFAQHFYNMLKDNKLIIGKKDPKTKGWIDPIRLLEERDNIPWEQMVKAANHYFKSLDDEFLPVIQSTRAFRQKFENLYSHAVKSKKTR